MNKRGYYAIALMFIVVIGVIVIFTLFFPVGDWFAGSSDGSETGQDEQSTENPDEGLPSDDLPVPVKPVCSDYLAEEACNLDSENVAIDQDEWNSNGCGDAVECGCVWNSNSSSCSFYFEEVIEEGVVDLEASKLTLSIVECGGGGNATCKIDLIGTVTNTGSVPIEEDFFCSFIDTENGDLLQLVKATAIVPVGGAINVTYQYTNRSFGDLSVRFNIDTSARIDEVDEFNNEASNVIGLP
ncbi:hypothetical protein AUJ63_04850 [Candidatus Pacearchaeota archaeon CG1_02_35_32]|nr:MAG: hypothetical protein AUJ63_04850 [Candidatus Pacearchaeota archaeon CG1_02_35_32]